MLGDWACWIVLVSFGVAALSGGLVRRVAPLWNLVDRPSQRKDHACAIPLGGGLAIWAGVVLPLAVAHLVGLGFGDLVARQLPSALAQHVPGLLASAPALWLLLGLASVLLLLGLVDDRWGVPWQIRLAVQFAVAGAAVMVGGWKLTVFLELPWLTNLLSVLWIVALINALNMLDNMDGLSAGVSAIVCAILAWIVFWAPNPEGQHPQLFVGGLLLVLLGSVLGFYVHNRAPARLFMGDAGSYFLGFSLATITMQATYAGYGERTWHAVFAPILVMAVPLYDMVSVLSIRIGNGKSPVQADHNHLSHRLVRLGMSREQSVRTIHLLTLTCGLAALLLHRVDQVGAWILMGLVACVLLVIAHLEWAASDSRKT